MPALIRAGNVLYMACGTVAPEAAMPHGLDGAEGVPGAMGAAPRPMMKVCGSDCKAIWLTTCESDGPNDE